MIYHAPGKVSDHQSWPITLLSNRDCLRDHLFRTGGERQRVVNAQLQAFTHTRFYADQPRAGSAAAGGFHKCPTLRSACSQVIKLSPLIFAQDGYPTSGEWKQRFPVTVCSNNTILNFYFTSNTREKVDTTMGIPGETRADIRLHRDARPYALSGATLLARSCQRFDIINSAFNGVEVSGKVDPTTQRVARLRTVRFVVGLSFGPGATGTLTVQHGGAVLH